MIASATDVTTSSESGTCMLTMIPASAAGTTPVSRVQARKTSSSRVHEPRRSTSRHARTTSGRATKMSVARTARAGQKWSAIACQGRFAPSVMKTSITIECDTVETNARISSS